MVILPSKALHKPPPGQAYGGRYSIQYMMIYPIIIIIVTQLNVLATKQM